MQKLDTGVARSRGWIPFIVAALFVTDLPKSSYGGNRPHGSEGGFSTRGNPEETPSPTIPGTGPCYVGRSPADTASLQSVLSAIHKVPVTSPRVPHEHSASKPAEIQAAHAGEHLHPITRSGSSAGHSHPKSQGADHSNSESHHSHSHTQPQHKHEKSDDDKEDGSHTHDHATSKHRKSHDHSDVDQATAVAHQHGTLTTKTDREPESPLQDFEHAHTHGHDHEHSRQDATADLVKSICDSVAGSGRKQLAKSKELELRVSEIFAQYGCITCHGSEGHGDMRTREFLAVLAKKESLSLLMTMPLDGTQGPKVSQIEADAIREWADGCLIDASPDEAMR